MDYDKDGDMDMVAFTSQETQKAMGSWVLFFEQVSGDIYDRDVTYGHRIGPPTEYCQPPQPAVTPLRQN